MNASQRCVCAQQGPCRARSTRHVVISMGYQNGDIRNRACIRISFDSVNQKGFMEPVLGRGCAVREEVVVFHQVECLVGRIDGSVLSRC